MSHSAIYGKAETKGHPDVKAIDVNQKVAGMSQERGATPLIYCCVEPSLQGAPLSASRGRAARGHAAPAVAMHAAGMAAVPARTQLPRLSLLCTFAERGGVYIGPKYFKG